MIKPYVPDLLNQFEVNMIRSNNIFKLPPIQTSKSQPDLNDNLNNYD
jgi:hypothetical protein